MIKLNLSIGPIKTDLSINPNGSIANPKITVKPKKRRKTKPRLSIKL